MKKTIINYSILFLFICHLSTAQQAIGYKLEKGNTFTVKQIAKQELVMKVQNTNQTVTNDLESLYNFTVVDTTGDL